jgi:hypothetical protein
MKTKRRTKNIICYKGYGSKKCGNHTVNQFKKTMKKHHIYNCLGKLCSDTKDKRICSLSRKCKSRNKQKKRFSTKQWVKWSKSKYGKCKK